MFRKNIARFVGRSQEIILHIFVVEGRGCGIGGFWSVEGVGLWSGVPSYHHFLSTGRAHHLS